MTNAAQINQGNGSVLAQLGLYESLKQGLLAGDHNVSQPEVVHQLRVFCKKVRAEAKFLRPKKRSAQAATSAKKLGSLLSAARDSHVVVNTLTELLPTSTESPLYQLKLMLQEKQCGEVLSHEKLIKVLAELSRGLRKLNYSGIAEKNTGKRARKSQKLFRLAFRSRNPEVFHRWRKSVKKEYYRALVQEGEYSDLESLRQLGSKLGKLHDLHHLLAVTEKRYPEYFPYLHEVVKEPIAAFEEAIWQLSGQLYR